MVATTEDTAAKDAPKTKKTTKSKRTAAEVEGVQDDLDTDQQDPSYVSARDPKMDTARWNSAPHPELWPSPDTNPDAEPLEDDGPASLVAVPSDPNVNLEFTLKASGLPVNTGVVWKLEGADHTGSPTFFAHKSDPFGDCHVVWRVQRAGTLHVSISGKRDHALDDSEMASADITILDPANDRRLGEARGGG